MGVAQAVRHGHAQGCPGQIEGLLFPAVQTAHAAEGIRVGVLARRQEVGGAQRRVHDAAGRAEDDGGTGTHAKRLVELLLGQGRRVDVRRANHAVDLAHGKDDVHVGVAVLPPTIVGSAASDFLATHGMMDTLLIFDGSTPSASA